MAPKRLTSSARSMRGAKSVKYTSDSGIDFSDIPESTEAEPKRARRVGQPKTVEAEERKVILKYFGGGIWKGDLKALRRNRV